jgi:hypothetical protein
MIVEFKNWNKELKKRSFGMRLPLDVNKHPGF